MKMAGLWWTALVLAFFLFPETTSAAVDQQWLTRIIETIKNEYKLGDSFSWAVNIPQNQDPNSLMQVLQDDPADEVKTGTSQGEVYQGKRMTAAAKSEALSDVLEKIKICKKKNEGNVLILYSEDYPNGNEDGVAKINSITQNWHSYAFAFSKVASVPQADMSLKVQAFKQQDISKFGLENIFRCYEPEDSFQCMSCSAGDSVTASCVKDSVPSQEQQDTGIPEPGVGGDEVSGDGSNEGTDVAAEKGSDEDTNEAPIATNNARDQQGGVMELGEHEGGEGRGGGKMKKGGEGKGGGKLKKGGDGKGGGKMKKGGEGKGGGKLKKGGDGKGGGKMKKGGEGKGGGKMKRSKGKGGGKMSKGGKGRRGGKMKKRGKGRGGGKMSKGGKGRGGGKMKKRGKGRGGGKMKKRGKGRSKRRG